MCGRVVCVHGVHSRAAVLTSRTQHSSGLTPQSTRSKRTLNQHGCGQGHNTAPAAHSKQQTPQESTAWRPADRSDPLRRLSCHVFLFLFPYALLYRLTRSPTSSGNSRHDTRAGERCRATCRDTKIWEGLRQADGLSRSVCRQQISAATEPEADWLSRSVCQTTNIWSLSQRLTGSAAVTVCLMLCSGHPRPRGGSPFGPRCWRPGVPG